MALTTCPSNSNTSVLTKAALEKISIPARKLLKVIAQEAQHGPLHPKPAGTATPPEILEACGISVEEFYTLLGTLQDAGLVRVSNEYPFEEIQLTPEAEEALREPS